MDIRDQWLGQNFIISMCGIKFWKGNENLGSVYNKPFFEILSGSFHFWPFQFSKKVIVPSVRWKLFPLNKLNGASKIRLFLLNFKNVQMILVKSAPKKVLGKKLFSHLKIFKKYRFFFVQNFFYVHFFLRSYVHFWNQYEKMDFLIPSVADPGCLSRIPDPDFYPSRIPDLGFRIQKQQQKREVKKN